MTPFERCASSIACLKCQVQVDRAREQGHVVLPYSYAPVPTRYGLLKLTMNHSVHQVFAIDDHLSNSSQKAP